MSTPEETAETTETSDLFEQAIAAAMADIPPAAEEAAPEEAQVATSNEVATSETPPAAPEPAKVEERVAPKLLKLLEREAAVVAQEQRVKAEAAELAALKAQVEELNRLKASFRSNRAAFIRQLDPETSPAEVAKELWYEELGDNAPPEYKAKREVHSVKSEVERMRAELAQERERMLEARKQQEAEAAYAQYMGTLESYAKTVPDELQYVKAYAQTSPEQVSAGLFKMAQRHARATEGREVLTAEQCAKLLNSELEKLAKIFSPPAPPKPSSTPAAAQPPITTLRNNHSSRQPAKSTADNEEALFQAALKAAGVKTG